MYKKVIALGMCVLLFMGCIWGGAGTMTATAAPKSAGADTDSAQTVSGSASKQPIGLMPLTGYEISAKDVPEEARESGIRPFSAVYESEWDACSNHFYYNQLSEKERDFYDALNQVCLSYLEGTKDAVEQTYGSEDEETEWTTSEVSTGSLDIESAKKVVLFFRYSNPQYYFLESTYLYTMTVSGTQTGYSFYLGIYPKFIKGSDRAKETEKVKTQLLDWKKQLDQESGDYAKAKKAQDLINAKVSYNHDIVNNHFEDEANAFSQSAYSVLCMDSTVCAGYTLSFEMLCNLAGIDTIAVTSRGHAWDKICLNDSWYNVDLTWDDNDGETYDPTYWYFVSTDEYLTGNGSASSHQPEDCWKPYLPACTLGSKQDSLNDKAGIPQTPVKRTTEPVISVSADHKVTITAGQDGADAIYYIVNGRTDPAPSSVRCSRYSGTFSVSNGDTVRAIAVQNARWNSNVVTQQVQEEKEPEKDPVQKPDKENEYKIEFLGNGSTGGKMSVMSCRYGKSYRLLANKFVRKGYKLKGWSTEANGTGKFYHAGASVKNLTSEANGKVTLYAQWTKVKYRISYQLNFGKNTKVNKTAYYVTTPTISLKNPTRKGYTFLGWYKNKNYKNKISKIKCGTTGNLKLYARWKKK